MRKGFTLVELLVVLSIIALLSSIILASLSSARQKAQVTVAQANEHTFEMAIQQLSLDTGKWLNACGVNSGTQISTSDLSPLITRPTVGTGPGPGCIWSSADVSSWNGPYMKSLPVDPWGNPYSLLTPTVMGDPQWNSYSLLLVSPGPDRSLGNYIDNIIKPLY